MAKVVGVFKDNMIVTERLRAEQEAERGSRLGIEASGQFNMAA